MASIGRDVRRRAARGQCRFRFSPLGLTFTAEVPRSALVNNAVPIASAEHPCHNLTSTKLPERLRHHGRVYTKRGMINAFHGRTQNRLKNR
jgi:hypothetical protein